MSDETANLTVADFLLARIAEDEGRATATHLFDCVLDHLDGRQACSCVIPARVLAECEAKRRIVEMWEVAVMPADQLADRIVMPSVRLTLAEVARVLALPYADHPDYRDDWRP